MNFVISSSLLLSHLQAVGKVISSKNTLPILDNYLFDLSDNELVITASDLETTFTTSIKLENAKGEGVIAIEAKRLNDILKEFSDLPLSFNIDVDTLNVEVTTENGKYQIKGQNGGDFPQMPTIKVDKSSKITVKADVLNQGILKTLFATADDELRPVMNGIFFEITEEEITFVASDAHKLVRYKRKDIESGITASFILPKKPASLLKAILPKEENQVLIEFDDKNAFFSLTNFKLICRLVEGNYPSYNSVIPQENPNKLIIDRVEFYNTLKRVSIFSNPASNLVKLELNGNQLKISAQDIDFAISAHERVNCQYDGDEMEIGFKSIFLIEILSNLSSSEAVMELSDPTRAGLLTPLEKDNEHEDVLMLLMPMMINS
ncbi:MAG: DNA polymerase III subunit beta [Bacteroidetes bacterium GWF2_38_335]|nr:MAG: DNA polymerase III subunit beta [Bacteroidetes bacterium GWF2_38_335]OFY80963.1 MAG: DNA polymerase III subunit beta [Bacteroidetes bacterium RIFOXYA12_FULL_38_20]HBS85100.1 DNA polymerase III subunit beta [Bacteroidales bacterium]